MLVPGDGVQSYHQPKWSARKGTARPPAEPAFLPPGVRGAARGWMGVARAGTEPAARRAERRERVGCIFTLCRSFGRDRRRDGCTYVNTVA